MKADYLAARQRAVDAHRPDLVEELADVQVDQEIRLAIQRQGQGDTYQEMTVNVTGAAQPTKQ